MKRVIGVFVAGIGLFLLLPFAAYTTAGDYVILAPQATLSEGGRSATAAYTIINLTDRTSGEPKLTTNDPNADTDTKAARRGLVISVSMV
ncbi:hypothetical protein [Kribbella sindirgiensis]|uniref:Uncharacterized protein n=1 Tax=Kribbella sindirgiensis TaxID=1124744 RepID=A0A4R0I2D1_9ACTN|nr:hypothetical protein [Kribbella sindirgiensis]TCC20564.1 hypothetical protein E0H50_36655 [Kribbella sindirgiensis]